jgi:ferrous iron transport protein A
MKPTHLSTLDQLSPRTVALVTEYTQMSAAHVRLMEMGLIPGAEIELMYQAPFSKDPIAVWVKNTLIALRRSEAQAIRVEVKA